MAIGVVLNETMSGSASIDGTQMPFAFSISAFTTELLNIKATRQFHGEVTLGRHSLPCHGELTIYITGPHYWLEFQHPDLGLVRAEGKKTYGKGGLIYSLTTCPMIVTANNKKIGDATVAYRENILAFPFSAIRLSKREKAFKRFANS